MLLESLIDIVRSEYTQWMRYTYLYSLGFGLYTDGLAEHFQEHGDDELEHAETISRWVVDLGGVPPTDLDPVPQFCGSIEEAIEFLIESERTGIEKYNNAIQLARDAGLYGLENDMAEIISVENEHMSDLVKYVSPNMQSEHDDTTIIIVADKEGQTGRDLIDFIYYVLVDEEPDINVIEAKDAVITAIETDVEDAYKLYTEGNEKAKEDLAILMHYQKIINEISNEDWNYLFESAKEKTIKPVKTEFEPYSLEEIRENLQYIAPTSDLPGPEETIIEKKEPRMRRPVEHVLVRDKSGMGESPVRPGDKIYNQNKKQIGQIVETFEDSITVRTKEGLEEWPLSDRIWTSQR